MANFHDTGFGHKFFNFQLPNLINAIIRNAEAIEKQNELVIKQIALSEKTLELTGKHLSLLEKNYPADAPTESTEINPADEVKEEPKGLEQVAFESVIAILRKYRDSVPMPKHKEERVDTLIDQVKTVFLTSNQIIFEEWIERHRQDVISVSCLSDEYAQDLREDYEAWCEENNMKPYYSTRKIDKEKY